MNPGGAGIPPRRPWPALSPATPRGAYFLGPWGRCWWQRAAFFSTCLLGECPDPRRTPVSPRAPCESPAREDENHSQPHTGILSVCSVPAAVFTSAGPAAGQRSPGVSRPWGGVEPETPLRGNPLGYERRCGSCRAGCPGLGESQGREARLLTGCLQYLGQVEPGGRGSDALDQSPSRAS